MSIQKSALFSGEIAGGAGRLEAHAVDEDTLQWQVVAGGKARNIALENIRGLPKCLQVPPEDAEIKAHMALLVQRYCTIRILDQKTPSLEITFGKFPITLLTPWGEFFEKEVSFADTIASLWKGLNIPEGQLSSESLFVEYHGATLNDARTIGDYSLLPGMGKLHVDGKGTACCDLVIKCVDTNTREPVNVVRAKSMMEGLRFPDLKNIDLVAFNPKAPVWRHISPGLNLFGFCKTPACPATGDWVYIPRGFGTFHMNEEACIAKCPQCHEIVDQVTNCSLHDCTYSIEGMRVGEKELFTQPNQKAPADGFIKFSGAPESMVKWAFLNITTKK